MSEHQDDKPASRLVRGDRGASMPEYALVFAFLAVLAIGTAQVVTTSASSQVDNQANCMSKRPPPTNCQIRPASTTTTAPPVTTAPATTTTRLVTTTTSSGTTTTTRPTTTTTVPPATGTLTVNKVSSPRGANASITVRSGTTAVAGAVVHFRYTFTAPGSTDTLQLTCTTDAAGTCTVSSPALYSDTTSIKVEVTLIDSSPAAGSLPTPVTVTFP